MMRTWTLCSASFTSRISSHVAGYQLTEILKEMIRLIVDGTKFYLRRDLFHARLSFLRFGILSVIPYQVTSLSQRRVIQSSRSALFLFVLGHLQRNISSFVVHVMTYLARSYTASQRRRKCLLTGQPVWRHGMRICLLAIIHLVLMSAMSGREHSS